MTSYLLEKSRIVSHAPEERNFHVFYEMLAGLAPEQRERYGLMSHEKYFYLNQVLFPLNARDWPDQTLSMIRPIRVVCNLAQNA